LCSDVSVSVCYAGGAVDLDLAAASTLGSGLFISCVMTASVVLIRTVDVVDTTAFVRDILAYMLANLLVLCFLWNGQLAAWEASMLILLYIVYVAVACYTSRSALLALCLAEHTLVPMLCQTTEASSGVFTVQRLSSLLSTCASGISPWTFLPELYWCNNCWP